MQKYIVFFTMILFLFGGCKYESREWKVLRGDQNPVTTLISSNRISQNESMITKSENNFTKEKDLVDKEVLKNSLEIERLKSKSKIELAKIEAEREKKVKEIEAQNAVKVASINKDVALQNQKIQKEIEEKRLEIFKIAIIVFGIILFLALLILYVINKKNRDLKLKLEEERIKKEKEMQLQEHQHQRVTKILDILSTKKLSPESEKEIINVLKESTKIQKVIESKSDENPKLIVKK